MGGGLEFFVTAFSRSTFIPHTGSVAPRGLGQPEQSREDPEPQDVERELVVDSDGAKDVGPGRTSHAGNEAKPAEQRIDDEGGGDHGYEHECGDADGELGAVVLAVDDDDGQDDEVGEDERHHAGEADASAPEDGSEGHVANGADEAEDGDDRPDERAPDDLDEVR